MNKLASKSFSWGLLTFTFFFLITSAGVQASVDSEAAAWFKRMPEAFQTQNYDGVFVYSHGNSMEALHIVHRFSEGIEQERIVRMDGSQHELIRDGDQVTCVHSAAWEGNINHQIPAGPFAKAFVRDITNLSDSYDLTMADEGRVAGRNAVILKISPKDDYRYGYQVWLDKETGLLLKSVLIYKGSVLERFQFTQLNIGAEIPDDALAIGIDGELQVHYPMLSQSQAVVEAQHSVWKLSWIPAGFVMRMEGVRRDFGSDASASTLTYTDGLAAFSVFIEKPGADRVENMAAQIGATVAVSTKTPDNHYVTVVGEVPMLTAQRLLQSVVLNSAGK